MTPERDKSIGDRARQFLESSEWEQAFHTYRQQVLEEMAIAKDVIPLQARIAVLESVKTHLESLVKHGAIAAQDIQLRERRGLLKKVLG